MKNGPRIQAVERTFSGGLAVIARTWRLKTHSFVPPAFTGFTFVEQIVKVRVT
jgi:hypothetical protein